MPKREARIARQIENRLKEEEKSARFRARLAASGVRTASQLETEKKVRLGADPGSIYGMRMTWTHDKRDCEGTWSWGIVRQWSEKDWDGVIAPKLAEWGKLTWAEIDRFTSDTGHKMHHSMETSAICGEAQDRLIELEYFEEAIFRFRLGNLPRLWGFRVVSHFEILWFDPTHQIYPID